MRTILWIILWIVGIIHRGWRIGNAFQWFWWMPMMMMMMMQDVCATFPAHDRIQLHVSLGGILGRVRKVCTNSQHRRCRGQLFQILFQETEVNHSSREVFLKTAARTCVKKQTHGNDVFNNWLLQETHLAEACARWCLNHETCSKGLKPARRIVVFFPHIQNEGNHKLGGHNLDNST